MPPLQRRQAIPTLLLGAVVVGLWLYLSGLTTTLRLGDTAIEGFLLVPSLPTPLYIVMAIVVLTAIGATLLASLRQRRRKPGEGPHERQTEAVKTPWQVGVSMLASLLMLLFVLLWFVRHGSQVSDILINLRADMEALQTLFANAGDAVTQVPSNTAGYVLFVVVLTVYGGLAILGIWALWESRGQKYVPDTPESAQTQRVRRAMRAGLRELQEHTDPRQAIIACYARLEYLLMDYGMPVAQHLTPQEYMSTALQDLDLPLDSFADLVRLFELARYSLYPLDDTARTQAITHLEHLKAHLEGEAVHAARP